MNIRMKSLIRILLTSAAIFIPLYFVFTAFIGGDTPAPSSAHAQEAQANDGKLFDETYQFIFFATLEGLYRDGVSSADVDSLLATKGKDGGYLNFIYTCPICMPVEDAIVTYKLRPGITHTKTENFQTEERTFGFGLPKEVSDALRSEKAGIRLKAVNELVSKWISYRMDHSSLTDTQKKNLIEELGKRRKEGMNALRSFASNMHGQNSMKFYAAGYEGGDECAVCNAALQMPLKLKSP